jgi:hypothetical protein
MATAIAHPPCPPLVPSAREAGAGEPPPVREDAGIKRHQMTQILGIDISPARCHAHMKASLMTPEQATLLEDKRTALSRAKARPGAPDPAEVAALRGEIAEINAGGVRIGGDASIAMATILNVAAQEILRYAMDRTIEADRKMVEVGALHSGELHRLGVWPLIRVLPSIAAYDPEYERNLKADRASTNRAAKKNREDARQARGEHGDEGDRPRGAGDDDPDLDEEGLEPTTTFNTYIDNVTKAVKAEEPYKAMRVSNRLREIISHASAELVGSLTRIAKIAVLDGLRVRTMTAAHLKFLAKILYVHQGGREVDSGQAPDDPTDEGRKRRDLGLLLGEIEDKVVRFRAYTRCENARKTEVKPPKEAEASEASTAAPPDNA